MSERGSEVGVGVGAGCPAMQLFSVLDVVRACCRELQSCFLEETGPLASVRTLSAPDSGGGGRCKVELTSLSTSRTRSRAATASPAASTVMKLDATGAPALARAVLRSPTLDSVRPS